MPPPKVGPYLRDLRKLFDKYGYHPSLYGHFGQGCIHCRVGFDLYTAEGIETFKTFMDEAADLVVRYGGSLSGEHGDGQARGEYLPKMFGDVLYQAFREFKSIWDPQWKMNPGKKIDAYGVAENLRVGADYNPPQPDTHFHFANDRHSFSRAALRCVGVGECRREGGQTMCPSYMVTREEKDCTRGRAHLLFEMMNGEVLTDGWKSEAVKDALDLCLACKGCKDDCPVNVDMATYKAEFLSHYYEGRLRPRHAYSMGWINRWARAGVAGAGPGQLLRPDAGPERDRQVARRHRPAAADAGLRPADVQGLVPPADAAATVRTPAGDPLARHLQQPLHARDRQGRRRGAGGRGPAGVGPGGELLLRPAAVRLRHARPRPRACCATSSTTLRPQIQAGIPIVGLEPSCVAVFRDELTDLFPNDEDAQRLSKQTFLLSEFLNQRSRRTTGRRGCERKALVHGHCHHKSVMGMEDEKDAAEKDRPRLRRAGGRLLRHGRLVRLRARRPLRRLRGLRRAGAAAGRAQGRSATRSSSPTASAASSRSSRRRIARRCTSRK